MSNITDNTGFVAVFAMSTRQRPIDAQGTALSGHRDAGVVFGEFTTIGSAVPGGRESGLGGFLGTAVLQGFRPCGAQAAKVDARTGSGVRAERELALPWGEPLANHAETTRRRYGAVGKCPRRIPA
ncbi:hypothetical protein BJF83_17950 [Nocardiopsis sp. CNR-923]|uniref:hypothetical protein n=1 Tax=Nocardiopsis sp. CNR-923 TaxID=1904965 RepID=UPI000966C6D6|nr:hypothetical protein [Nocardiopsis sp. CNR-923]OLT27661.1 hypothetical protein BJF83_17950 [Nocardiopsis sp. CNR-923]